LVDENRRTYGGTMNPLVGGDDKIFYGKHLIEGWLNPRKKRKPWQYSVMKKKQIAKRRACNKLARKSRRINRLRCG
jgi:hypothetical protein